MNYDDKSLEDCRGKNSWPAVVAYAALLVALVVLAVIYHA